MLSLRCLHEIEKDKLRKVFSPANIQLMQCKRDEMDKQELVWALFSFNNVENELGARGGIYEILENEDIIYISGLPKDYHVRDALNAHFNGNDKLPLGEYLKGLNLSEWRNFFVRFLVSETPRDDARLLLRYFQLQNKGKVPKYN